ncbi:dihydrolipoyl dehydrogenase [Vulgatibacter incomptus]|uniref:Dihydrolipoyl dehydrogenase n=1 Tax=Vulgatibacter incomptus TaxID=1391653 RepID=A0A0K1P9S0_9BACT|nr:dihydrolipoyl dehydrogenase [Vulgatibacter incomptus]AKU90260.1 Dihydrolipoamide dehydrogenase of 2-oxoglutarate dehydrogenase [Vulgatibacter incomptus]
METFDLVVIGAGPGGYVAAIRAAQLGMKVACVEKEKALGGTCLRVGCIPSKALLEASHVFAHTKHGAEKLGVRASGVELDLPTMLAHKDAVVKANTSGVDGLFMKNKVKRVLGTGRITAPGKVSVRGADGSEQTLEAKRILIATGSAPALIPGVELDGAIVGTSDEAIDYQHVPQRMIVIGGGVIGLELGSVWSRLGAEVTVIEFLPRLMAGMDDELAAAAQKIFSAQGMRILVGCRVQSAKAADGVGKVVFLDADGKEQSMEAEKVLVAVGRKPFTDGLGLAEVGVKLDGRGRVEVDQRFETNVPGVYAIGDVIRGAMLAHKAEEEGMAAVELMVGKSGHVTYDAIPNVVYTDPEIASVGKTEAELQAAGVSYKKGTFPFRFNGRARAMNATEGFAKILADAKTDRILSAHIIGARAGDLIAELAVAIEMMASSEDIARSSHAHPSLAEIVKEAALDVEGRAIHK